MLGTLASIHDVHASVLVVSFEDLDYLPIGSDHVIV